jgi:hypothetical protein
MVADFEETKKIGLRFSEKMSGYLAQGVGDFSEGENKGQKQNDLLSFEVKIHVEDGGDFCKLSGRKARLEGTVSYRPLGQNLSIRNGEFSLFRPDRKIGKRYMPYEVKANNYFFPEGNHYIFTVPSPTALLPPSIAYNTRRWATIILSLGIHQNPISDWQQNSPG